VAVAVIALRGFFGTRNNVRPAMPAALLHHRPVSVS